MTKKLERLDHGTLNLPLGHKARGGSIDKSVDAAIAVVKQFEAMEREKYEYAAALRKAREAARVRFTAEQLKSAKVVRDAMGWHEVVRVSKSSVSVKTPYSWTDRIKIENILDFKE